MFKQTGGDHEIPFCSSDDDGNAGGPRPLTNELSKKTPLELKYEREDRERAENEKAYNDTMKRLKSQAPATTNSDPWKTVRPASESNAKR